jgi:hypothetical protein
VRHRDTLRGGAALSFKGKLEPRGGRVLGRVGGGVSSEWAEMKQSAQVSFYLFFSFYFSFYFLHFQIQFESKFKFKLLWLIIYTMFV